VHVHGETICIYVLIYLWEFGPSTHKILIPPLNACTNLLDLHDYCPVLPLLYAAILHIIYFLPVINLDEKVNCRIGSVYENPNSLCGLMIYLF
jgi:hypothetical protein